MVPVKIFHFRRQFQLLSQLAPHSWFITRVLAFVESKCRSHAQVGVRETLIPSPLNCSGGVCSLFLDRLIDPGGGWLRHTAQALRRRCPVKGSHWSAIFGLPPLLLGYPELGRNCSPFGVLSLRGTPPKTW